MGGSGGYFSSYSIDPEKLAQKTREAEDKARSEGFETEVNEFLSSELAEYNKRDVDGIKKIFESVKNDIEGDIEGTIELIYGGSISKHTYVDGLSDVDALVLIDKSELIGELPIKLQQFFADILKSRYGEDSVSIGQLAVTLTVNDKNIQFIPALRDGDKYKIGSASGNRWSRINPQKFSEALTKINKRMDGKLVPCIKLVKAIINKLPEKRRLTGYHTESLTIKIFKDYNGSKNPKEMVRYFFENAPIHVKQPIRDSSGQSIYVDEYLGDSNSVERLTVSDSLGRIARKIRNADGDQSLESWKELFES